MIRLERVTVRYPTGREGLLDVSLAVPESTMLFVTGHSGAGKSTLLRLLLGLETAATGRTCVHEVDLATLAGKRMARYRRQIGVVLQDPMLLPQRTVFDNVVLPLLLSAMLERDRARRVRAALSAVDLLGREDALPTELSTGERQRISIARAIVHRPRLVLADEPTGNLDPALSREVMALFERFCQIGTTVIVATHETGLVAELGQPVIELAGGRLVRRA